MATTARAGYTYDTIMIARFDYSMDVAHWGDSTTQYFPVRHICRWLGIDPGTQFEVLRTTSTYADAVIELLYDTRTRGWRPAVWLRRDKFALWLLGIDAKRCALRSREKLSEWQDAVLQAADALLFGAAPAVPPAARGGATSSVRVETHMHCLDCGAPHHVIVENGQTTVLRERDGEEE